MGTARSNNTGTARSDSIGTARSHSTVGVLKKSIVIDYNR